MNSEVSNIEKELQDLETKKQNAEARLSEIITAVIKKIGSNHNQPGPQIVNSKDLLGHPWSPSFYDWNASREAIMEFLSKLPVQKWKMSLIDKLVSAKNGEDYVFFNSSYSVNGIRYTNNIPVSTDFIKAILEEL